MGKVNTFKRHCSEKAATASQRINMIKLLRGRNWGANPKTLLRIYKQLIRPVLEYGAVAYSDRHKNSIKLLELAERRALRVVLRAGIKATNMELYDRTGLQPLGDRLKFLKAKAISRYDKESKGMQDLEILKQIMCTK